MHTLHEQTAVDNCGGSSLVKLPSVRSIRSLLRIEVRVVVIDTAKKKVIL